MIYDDMIYTYEAVENMACRVANIAKSWGLQAGDCVAIMIQNEPSFIYTFLGKFLKNCLWMNRALFTGKKELS